MSEKKHELLLIAAALVITITTLLYSVFDSPKYNSIEAIIITATAAQTQEATALAEKININTATADELSQLDGIGGKKAQAIVEYREKNGRFRAAEELTNVSGISASILEKNIERIAV